MSVLLLHGGNLVAYSRLNATELRTRLQLPSLSLKSALGFRPQSRASTRWRCSAAWIGQGKKVPQTTSGMPPPATFPEDYEEMLAQSQAAVSFAIDNGVKLMAVEFPPNGLESVAGDSDGATEMNRNTVFLRSFCDVFIRRNQGSKTRVFFPDAGELELAVVGAGINPNIGQWEIEPVFDDSPFRLDYLNSDSLLSEMSYKMMGYQGAQTRKKSVADLVQSNDEVFVVGYPSDNAEEMLMVQELFERSSQKSGVPIVVFNGQLDDIRSAFFMKLLSPKLHRLQQEFLPMIEVVYYIHNFKGSRPGVLFRAYPGPWQVYRRAYNGSVSELLYESDTMPSLKTVALEILPK